MSQLIVQRVLVESFKAAATITAGQGVKLDATNDPAEVTPSGDGERGMGIAMDGAATGEMVLEMIIGIHWMIRGTAAVTAGNTVATDANGNAVPATIGEYGLGIALSTPGSAAEKFPVFVNPSLVATA